MRVIKDDIWIQVQAFYMEIRVLLQTSRFCTAFVAWDFKSKMELYELPSLAS